jgi:putative tricarboxylic transport membrane protein
MVLPWNAIRSGISASQTISSTGDFIMRFLENIIAITIIVITAFVLLATINDLRAASSEWKPERPIEFVVPVGCCVGGANDMARLIKVISERHHVMDQNILVINRSTGPASEGYVYLKKYPKDTHKIGMAITSIFSNSLAYPGGEFHYTQLTPIAMLALDDFILWVPTASPFRTSDKFFDHVRQNPGQVTLGGLGTKQEDQIVTAAVEQARGIRFQYVPYRSGGDVARDLAGGHINSTVNNPSEGIQFWRSGKIRPLCVFSDQRIPYRDIIADGMSWNDVPTCREQGTDVTYKMMRSVFAPADLDPRAKRFYQDFLRRITSSQDWHQYIIQNALEPKFMTDREFDDWLKVEHQKHEQIMINSGWIQR